MKRRIIALFMATILAGILPIMVSASEKVYMQAAPSADTTVTLMQVEDGRYNILKNSDFEIVDENGKAVEWEASGATYGESIMVVQGTKEDPAPSGENYLRLWHADTHIGTIYTSYDAIGGETYDFSMKFRCPDREKKSVAVYVSAYEKKEDGTYGGCGDFHQFTQGKGEDWTEFSYSIELPPETARLTVWLRLLGGGEVHFDDVRLVGKLTGVRETAEAFRAQLVKEREKDDATNVLTPGELREYDPPFSGQENVLKNGDFEENDGKVPEDWGIQSRFAPYITIVEGESHDGSDCVKLSFNGPEAPSTAAHPFLTQNVKLVGGAEYQVSFWYKISTAGGTPTIKLEYHTDRSLPGAQQVGEKYVYSEKFDNGSAKEGARDGKWTQGVYKIYPQQTVQEASVLVRMLTSSVDENELFIDDVEIYMTQAPPAFELDAGKVFYYPDAKEGTLSTSIHTGYYSDLTEAKVQYEFLDTDWKTVIWKKENVISQDGKTEVSFPVSIMKEKEKPYRVRATLYNTDNSVHSVATQNVYLYDRPAWLREDGVFLKGGKDPVEPIIGYHVINGREGELQKSAEAVNTIQIGAFSTAEDAIETMDMLEENGVMGMVVLYPGMKCAGNEANIDKTAVAVSALKDHPAVLGYIVMDEVFLHGGEPSKDLEASYRLIRSIDKNHPVTVMEAMSAYYEKAGKYVDLLLIDPYSSAKEQAASRNTQLALEAVDYEKPVYAILETYKASTPNGYRFNTGNDGRNNNWQALIAGTKAVGYYSVGDCESAEDGTKLELWNATDGGDLWRGLVTFAEEERELAFSHFAHHETPEFNEYIGDEYWYSAWTDGKDVYMIVLGMMDYGTTKDISIPLESFSGSVKIGEYTATLLAGREKKEIASGNGTLDVTIEGVEALFYKITPSEAVDFSNLGITKFQDLDDFAWAREAIGRMDEANVITGRNIHKYAPGEKITRGEFAGFLVRALGLTSDSTEQFADVDADYEFAKEIAIGKALGVLKGTDGVNYNPDSEISRQDLMVICARGMRLKKALEEGGEMTFSDKDAISDYAVADIAAMVRAGIVAGYTDGTIQPLGNTTRAEAAVIMDRIVTWNKNP